MIPTRMYQWVGQLATKMFVYVTGHGKWDQFNKFIKCIYEQVKF